MAIALAFGDSVGGWIGGLDKAFFAGRYARRSVSGTIPEIVFASVPDDVRNHHAGADRRCVCGAHEVLLRPDFALAARGCCWSTHRSAHWVWGGGWLAALGVLDFRWRHRGARDGRRVSALVHGQDAWASAVRLSLNQVRPPHNPGMTATGAAMLWVGWFGFNGGSQLAADGGAGMAIAVTHISAATAAITGPSLSG